MILEHLINNTIDLNHVKLAYKNSQSFKADLSCLKQYFYPQFGVLILKSNTFYCAVNFSSIGQNGRGGHSHNDKLSFDLTIDNEDLFRDPGSYLYTSNTKMRNILRSSFSHNIPILEKSEQNTYYNNNSWLFLMKDETRICYNCQENKYIFECSYRDNIFQRHFKLNRNEIIITDFANKKFHYPKVNYYSPFYGELNLAESSNHSQESNLT